MPKYWATQGYRHDGEISSEDFVQMRADIEAALGVHLRKSVVGHPGQYSVTVLFDAESESDVERLWRSEVMPVFAEVQERFPGGGIATDPLWIRPKTRLGH